MVGTLTWGPKIEDRGGSVKKVLLIRFSSIGDIVLTSPLVRVLKESYGEGVELHFLLKAPFADLLRANPHIDKLHLWEKEKNGGLLSQLRKERFDHIVDLQCSLRSYRVRAFLKRPASGFPKLNLQKWLLVRFKRDRLPKVHVVDRYFKALRPLGLENDMKGLEFHIPDKERMRPSDLGLSENAPFVCFSIGAAHATKRLPEERILALCQRIEVPVLLLGGPDDAERGERIAGKAGGHVHSTCGRLSVPASASLIEQSAALLTHDTGMMHIAAAFRKPILSFWGNTVPSFGMYPYMPGNEDRSHVFEVEGLSCRPCSKIGHDSCPKGHFRCMQDIDLNRALNVLNGVLEKEGG